jgi:glycosyltransferase involved in cell wall biosynthesis
VFRRLKPVQQVNPKQIRAPPELRQFHRRHLPHSGQSPVASDVSPMRSEDRLHVVYNGVDLERFRPKRLAERRSAARQQFHLADDALVFALVAHNFKLKGVAELIEAAALLNHTGHSFHLVIAGKANPRRYLGNPPHRVRGPDLTTIEDARRRRCLRPPHLVRPLLTGGAGSARQRTSRDHHTLQRRR